MTAKSVSILVRRAVRGDRPSLLDLEAATAAPWSQARLVDETSPRGAVSAVATTADKGLVLGWMLFLTERERLNLRRVVVAPKWRRRRVGSCLMDWMFDRQRQQQRSGVRAFVNEEEHGVVLFLKACGFRWIKTERQWFGPDRDGWIFESVAGGLPASMRVA
jgi:L-amino acid N-acyltransferase YncA